MQLRCNDTGLPLEGDGGSLKDEGLIKVLLVPSVVANLNFNCVSVRVAEHDACMCVHLFECVCLGCAKQAGQGLFGLRRERKVN